MNVEDVTVYKTEKSIAIDFDEFTLIVSFLPVTNYEIQKKINTKIDKAFHNKVVSFFTRQDVIDSFPIHKKCVTQDITTRNKDGIVYGSFCSNGAYYYIDNVTYIMTLINKKNLYSDDKTTCKLKVKPSRFYFQ